jgi:hypothetical protein
MSIAIGFLVIALVLAAIGAWSRWWPGDKPYYPTILCSSFFFYLLYILYPLLQK